MRGRKRDEDAIKKWKKFAIENCSENGINLFHFSSRILIDSNIKPQIMEFHNLPDDWITQYKTEKYHEYDPMEKWFKNKLLPFFWPPKEANMSANVKAMYEEAKEFGLFSGVSFGYQAFPAHRARFSVVCNDTKETCQCNQASVQYQMYLLGALLSEAHCEHEKIFAGDMSRGMTNREKECLRWVAEGKTSTEIALILGISKRTAAFHLENAMRKWGTNSRTSTAVKSILFAAL